MKEVRTIIAAEENEIDLHVFVKKHDDEGKEFYYLGEAIPDKQTVTEDKMRDKHR